MLRALKLQTMKENIDPTLLNNMHDFTTNLYKYLASHTEENFVFSGLSVYLALLMCALGAENDTAKEILDVLCIDLNSCDDFIKLIVNYLKGVENAELLISNRIFADVSIPVKNSFKERIRGLFHCDVTNVEFSGQCAEAVEIINNWCAKETKNRIRQIIADTLSASTKMILANIVYFRAAWHCNFDPNLTLNKPFFIDDKTTIVVPTMHSRQRCLYQNLESFNAELVSIPYKNGDYYFTIIRPKTIQGFQNLEMNLDHIETAINNPLNGYAWRNINLGLPKFKIESTSNLVGALKNMGISQIFQADANLEKISGSKPLYVNELRQKAFIDMDEKGTEAVAITNLSVTDGVCQYFEFDVDRPFLYKIVQRVSNLTLFSGRVFRPTY